VLRLEGEGRLFSASRGMFVCTDNDNKMPSSKEQRPPSEANSFLANLEFVHILWNPIITVLTLVYHLFYPEPGQFTPYRPVLFNTIFPFG